MIHQSFDFSQKRYDDLTDGNLIEILDQQEINRRQTELGYNELFVSDKVLSINQKFNDCGKDGIIRAFCKLDHNGKGEKLMKTKKIKFHCGIRFCSKTECKIESFARTLEDFNSIPQLKGLRNLWHCTIGFQLLETYDFRENFSKYKKRHELLMGSLFKKVKKKGIDLKGIRVLDFSFTKTSDGSVYVHYHFGIIPVKHFRKSLQTIKSVEKDLIKNMKIKTPFHFQSFGYKNKNAILSYLAKRCIGLYKFDESKNLNYSDNTKGKLKRDIENKVYFMLKDVLTPEQYVRHFYKKRHYVTFGGLPHGSIPTDNSFYNDPIICKQHGLLEKTNIRFELEIDPRPPDPPSMTESVNFEVVYLGSPQNECRECGLNVHKEEFNFKTQSCRLCFYKTTSKGKQEKFQIEFSKFLNNERGSIKSDESFFK